MNSVWVQRTGAPSALLFFAGWAMDERPFRHLRSSHDDVCICSDYRGWSPEITADAPLAKLGQELASYDSITVVAWSFGCAVAAQAMAAAKWPVRSALAINGTVTPEDEETGIPRRWLDATAAGLLDGGWPKFVRRMCVARATREFFERHEPHRDLASIVTELEALRQLKPPTTCHFTRAFVGSKDRILLPENQQRGWQRLGVPTQTIVAPHYPFHLWETWDEIVDQARQ